MNAVTAFELVKVLSLLSVWRIIHTLVLFGKGAYVWTHCEVAQLCISKLDTFHYNIDRQHSPRSQIWYVYAAMFTFISRPTNFYRLS